jgi:hypothetical protein
MISALKTMFGSSLPPVVCTSAPAYEKNFRLRDKNHAPFKLNGQSRTAFGLLKAPALQRLSVTVEVISVRVMIVYQVTSGQAIKICSS